MSEKTKLLLAEHIEAIRRWHESKHKTDQVGDASILITQGMMRETARRFAESDASDREARRAQTLLTEVVP